MLINLKYSRKNSGFTLLETLVALIILGIGLITLAKFQSNMIRSNTLAKQRTEAAVLAQNAIEKFRGQISDTNPANNISSGNDRIQSSTTTFTRNWDSTAINNNSGNPTGDIELKVTVTWPDISKLDSSGNALVSDATSVYLASIISNQAFSDSAIRLKISNQTQVELDGPPTSGGSSSGGGGGSSGGSSGGSGSGGSGSGGSGSGCSGGGSMMSGGGMMGGGCGGGMMMGGGGGGM